MHAYTHYTSRRLLTVLTLCSWQMELEEKEYQMTEAEYKLMLLEHWKERVAGGIEAMPEHDVGVSVKARAMHRKKRKIAGILHPMFDTAPPTFLQQMQSDPSALGSGTTADEGWGDYDEDEEGPAQEQSARPQPSAGTKKSRSGKPLTKSLAAVPALMPFGNGPFSTERRQAWAAAMKQVCDSMFVCLCA